MIQRDTLYQHNERLCTCVLQNLLTWLKTEDISTQTHQHPTQKQTCSRLCHHEVTMTLAATSKKPDAPEAIPDFARITLVPIANPATAPDLLRLALSLIEPVNGRVIALSVSTGTLENEASILVELEEIVNRFKEDEKNIEIESVTATSIARGILDSAREIGADVIVLGIKQAANQEVRLGTVVESVISASPCDVIVYRLPASKTPAPIERIVVPVDGSTQSRVAARTAIRLAKNYDVKIEAIHSQGGHHSHHEGRARIEESLEDLPENQMVKRTVITAQSPSSGLLARSRPEDLFVVGFSERSELERWMFGDVTRDILNKAPGPVAMVSRSIGGDQLTTRVRRRVTGWVRPVLTRVEQEEIVRQARDMATMNIDYTVLILISATLATLGLLLNSAAVIIGAMLVAPLMSPLIGISVGITVGNIQLSGRATLSIFLGICMALIVAFLTGILIPNLTITPEMASRGNPTLLDAGVALASGIAGAYATARKDIPAALAGVAIAAALMPPLCTVGLGLALMDLDLAFGAALLFLTNIISIVLSGSLVFAWLDMNPGKANGQLVRRQMFSFIVLFLITVPVVYELIILSQRANDESTIGMLLATSLEPAEIVEFEVAAGETLRVRATVRSEDEISPIQVTTIQQGLSQSIDQDVALELIVWRLIRGPVVEDTEEATEPGVIEETDLIEGSSNIEGSEAPAEDAP